MIARGRESWLSWGRFPSLQPAGVRRLHWRDEALPATGSLLARGCGRSYGDSCLNEGGELLDARGLDRLISFDRAAGLVRCEAGVTFDRLIERIVPAGWFLPVTPGTRHVTVGGAIANDVHGKNHHVAGTFGCHVTMLEVLRSDGSRIQCSPERNRELFAATVGGLGLTGLITWAEFRLRAISTTLLDVHTSRFHHVGEFLSLSAQTQDAHEHAVAWVDTTSRGKGRGRGLFMRANHLEERGPLRAGRATPVLGIPFELPVAVLSRGPVNAFNAMHYGLASEGRRRVELEAFFYPLDAIANWNRLYGRAGFVQHQCVVPMASAEASINAMLDVISSAGAASFLSVLKVFGSRSSPGLLSFPRPGVTFALDLPVRGAATFALLERLDAIVMEAGGAIYPAKDARMSAETFRRSFPRLERFVEHVDPRFSSSLWRRVHG